jgi:hypothetical protein
MLGNLTKVEVAKIVARASFRAALAKAGMARNSIKSISRGTLPNDPVLVATTNGIFKYVPGKTDGTFTSSDQLVPVDGPLGTGAVGQMAQVDQIMQDPQDEAPAEE